MQVTYSAFFAVKPASTTQSFTTGELSVTIDGSKKIEALELYPVDSTVLPKNIKDTLTDDANNMSATLNLNNVGTVDADFMVTIDYDNLPEGRREDELLDFQYLLIGIYDTDKNEWVSFSKDADVFYTSISGLTPSNGVYPILRSVVTSGKTRNFKVYVWLAEKTPTTEIGKLVYLKLEVKSTPVAGVNSTEENSSPNVVS